MQHPVRDPRDLGLGGLRMLATDLDGTLLRPDHTVSDATRAAIAEATTAGIHIVFVTGRPPRWMRAVAETTGHAGTAVCANGAVALDMHNELIVRSHAISSADLVTSAAAIQDVLGDDALMAAEQAPLGELSDSCLRHEPGFIPTELQARLGHDFRSEPRAELLRRPAIVKLLARGSGPVGETEVVAAAVHARVGHRVTVTHSSKTHLLLEVAPGGVTKATALAELAAMWGLGPEHVVAIGDMPNDMPLLRWAGHALTVASGHPSLRSVAEAVIGDPEDDGVAGVLRVLAASTTD